MCNTNRLTTEEFVDVIINNVTLNGKLPMIIGPDNIERIIEYDALKFFYREYKFALRKTYYYVDLISLKRNSKTDTKILTLPNEIESVSWCYIVNYNDIRNLGYVLPQNSISLGQTSMPYVANFRISEFGQSIAVTQSLAAAVQSFSKNTVKHHFDPNSKMFEILTSVHHNLVLEVYAQIPREDLYSDPYFLKYVTGVAMSDYATELSFTDLTLAGNSKINTDRIYDRGQALIQETKDYINKMPKTSFIINRTA